MDAAMLFAWLGQQFIRRVQRRPLLDRSGRRGEAKINSEGGKARRLPEELAIYVLRFTRACDVWRSASNSRRRGNQQRRSAWRSRSSASRSPPLLVAPAPGI